MTWTRCAHAVNILVFQLWAFYCCSKHHGRRHYTEHITERPQCFLLITALMQLPCHLCIRRRYCWHGIHMDQKNLNGMEWNNIESVLIQYFKPFCTVPVPFMSAFSRIKQWMNDNWRAGASQHSRTTGEYAHTVMFYIRRSQFTIHSWNTQKDQVL